MRRRYVVVAVLVVLVAAVTAVLAVTGSGHERAGARPPSTCSVYLANGAAIVVLTTQFAEVACIQWAEGSTMPSDFAQSARFSGGGWRWQKGERAHETTRHICTGTSSSGATIRVYGLGRESTARDVCRFVATDDNWTLHSD